ncbi:MAG: hypothetical protein AAGA75_20450, partial [Cyanobacteria bacterium P01_E01_bin.6]
SNSHFGFSSHFEVKNVRREAILEQQNDGFGLQHSFSRENHFHTENCWSNQCHLDNGTSCCIMT